MEECRHCTTHLPISGRGDLHTLAMVQVRRYAAAGTTTASNLTQLDSFCQQIQSSRFRLGCQELLPVVSWDFAKCHTPTPSAALPRRCCGRRLHLILACYERKCSAAAPFVTAESIWDTFSIILLLITFAISSPSLPRLFISRLLFVCPQLHEADFQCNILHIVCESLDCNSLVIEVGVANDMVMSVELIDRAVGNGLQRIQSIGRW